MTRKEQINKALAFVTEWKSTDQTIVDFCAQRNLNVKTFMNWHRRWKIENGIQTDDAPTAPEPKNLPGMLAMTAPTLSPSYENLLNEVHDLRGKLHDANIKIKALSNVVIILGAQVGDE